MRKADEIKAYKDAIRRLKNRLRYIKSRYSYPPTLLVGFWYAIATLEKYLKKIERLK